MTNRRQTKKQAGQVARVDSTKPVRVDGPYEDIFLGGSNRRNARKQLNFDLDRLTLSNIYAQNGLARQIVDIYADDMLRAGFEIDGIEETVEHDIEVLIESLRAVPLLTDALRWAVLFGGGLVVMLVNDGGQLIDPLQPEKTKSIEALRVYDRWEVSYNQFYTDPASRKFGEPEYYMISPSHGTTYTVHESRCLVFDGLPVPNYIRQLNDGWGGSRLQACFDSLTRLGDAHGWVASLIERAQQAVHKMAGLADALATKEGQDGVVKRIGLVDTARSINNTIAIDAEGEEYELKSTSFASIPDTVDRLSLALCAAAGIPESMLFGTQYGGLNGAGTTDLKTWQAKISQAQHTMLKPQLDRLISILLYSLGVKKQDYTIEFCPLVEKDEKQDIENKYKQAQTLDILQTLGAIDQIEAQELAPEILDGLEEVRAKLELEKTIDPSKAAQLTAEVEENDE